MTKWSYLLSLNTLLEVWTKIGGEHGIDFIELGRKGREKLKLRKLKTFLSLAQIWIWYEYSYMNLCRHRDNQIFVRNCCRARQMTCGLPGWFQRTKWNADPDWAEACVGTVRQSGKGHYHWIQRPRLPTQLCKWVTVGPLAHLLSAPYLFFFF